MAFGVSGTIHQQFALTGRTKITDATVSGVAIITMASSPRRGVTRRIRRRVSGSIDGIQGVFGVSLTTATAALPINKKPSAPRNLAVSGTPT